MKMESIPNVQKFCHSDIHFPVSCKHAYLPSLFSLSINMRIVYSLSINVCVLMMSFMCLFTVC